MKSVVAILLTAGALAGVAEVKVHSFKAETGRLSKNGTVAVNWSFVVSNTTVRPAKCQGFWSAYDKHGELLLRYPLYADAPAMRSSHFSGKWVLEFSVLRRTRDSSLGITCE